MPSHVRRQLFVDRNVQGALLLRVVMYWIYCLFSVAFMITCWLMVYDRPESTAAFWSQMQNLYIPALAATVLLLPIAIVDLIRLSNRFAGPMLRLRRTMKQLADGERVHPVHFRDGDFWFDFAEDFNRVLARVQQPESEPAEQSEETEETPVAV